MYRFVCILFFGIVAAACSTPQGGGLVSDPSGLGEGRHIDRSQLDATGVPSMGLSAIVLAEIDTTRVSDQKGITKTEGAAALRAALMPSPSDRAVLNLGGSAGPGRLDVAIVERSTGNALARVIAGELGSGHAWVQVDARVVDPDSGKVLAELSDRRRGSGVIGLRDTFGSSGPAMVREMLAGIGSDIRKELRELFEPQ